jgi:K+-sensing histidine kinase KdpD
MKSHVERYGAAAGLTLAGVAIALLFQRVRGIPDAMIFAATVALTARFFGVGPSLFASALSIVAIDFTMLPPLGRLEFTHPEEIAYLAVFVVLSLVISGTTHSLRVAQSTAERIASRATRLLDVTTALAEAELPADVARVMIGQGLGGRRGGVGIDRRGERRRVACDRAARIASRRERRHADDRARRGYTARRSAATT